MECPCSSELNVVCTTILEGTFQTYGHRQSYKNSELSFFVDRSALKHLISQCKLIHRPLQRDQYRCREEQWKATLSFLQHKQQSLPIQSCVRHSLGITPVCTSGETVYQWTYGEVRKESKIYLYCCEASSPQLLSVLVVTRIFKEMDNKCRVSNKVGEENRIKWKGILMQWSCSNFNGL